MFYNFKDFLASVGSEIMKANNVRQIKENCYTKYEIFKLLNFIKNRTSINLFRSNISRNP